uniref:ADP-ribosylation factor-like protein 11 n=1 Tax=Aceria tosichella TaxID=561515 RepID=A0A6G1S8Q9_9ACAR
MGAAVAKNAATTIWDNIPSFSNTHIVMLGLDCSGKTTVLYRLKFGQYINTVPTIGFNCEKIRVQTSRSKGVNFIIWDIGGQDRLRPLWRSYTRCTDGIIFVVDSVDEERLEEAKMELLKIALLPENKNVPILVLANKQDLPGAKEAKEIASFLGLNDLNPSHLWHVQPTCAVIGDGLEEGLDTLYNMILKRRNK